MSLARELVDLENRLRGEGVDPFAPFDAELFQAVPGVGAFVGRLRALPAEDASRVLRLVLQALRIKQDQLAPNLIDAEFVATLPPEAPGIARPTRRVLTEMLERATHEVILLGYEFSDEVVVGLLAAAVARGAAAIIICDRERGAAHRIAELWPAEVARPRLFEDRPRVESAPFASMHAKCVLVDGGDLLISSANFTYHGLEGNIEIGVRLSGPPVAEARKLFSHLVEKELVVEVSS